MKLSKEQKHLVTCENIPILVKAAAGSGKTRVLTERIKYLLPKTNKKILALTFTNKAGEEIKERLSLEERKRVFAGTFHSFAQMVLENHGHLIGYSKETQIFENEKDRLKIIEEAIEKIPNIYNKFISWKQKEKNNYLRKVFSELLSLWSNYAKNTEKKSLNQFKNQISIGRIYSRKELKGVTLSTIHTMKGQEYDIVFIIGVDDGNIPYYKSFNNSKELQQEKNNLYVAFTRAKRFLYVSYPENRLMPWGDVKKREISRFLESFKNL